MIYMVQADDGPVKIGYSKSMATFQARLDLLEWGHFMSLRVIRTIEDAEQTDERRFHEYFADCRIKREWFTFNEEMLTISLDSVRLLTSIMPCEYNRGSSVLKAIRFPIDLYDYINDTPPRNRDFSAKVNRMLKSVMSGDYTLAVSDAKG